MIQNNRQQLLATAFLAVGVFISANVQAQNNECKRDGYMVGLFNGVLTTEMDANDNALEVIDLLAKTEHKGHPIKYEVFYNQTGIGRKGATLFEDFAEVFQQRSQEIFKYGHKRWELYWEAVSGNRGEDSWLAKLASTDETAFGFAKNLYTDLSTIIAGGWSYLLSNPPTLNDYAAHRTRLTAAITEGKKVLLFAHSQGNLFANAAYDHALTLTDANSVKVAHVASAATRLHGSQTLASIDLPINALRVIAPATTPPINVQFSARFAYKYDFLGHGLLSTYLNPAGPAAAKIKQDVANALSALKTPNTKGSPGFFTVTLTWDGQGDVDLHVVEPSGNHVYFVQKAGSSGYLDVDNRDANGPEHYFASCNPDKLQNGVYKIGINNYYRATGRTATVQVATAQDGEIFTTSLPVGEEKGINGSHSPIPVASVLVEQKDGKRNAIIQR